MSPTVAEASAFVAAAVAASPGGQTASDTDAAARLAALLEKRPKLKVVRTSKNKLSGRELAGLSDDEEEGRIDPRAAASEAAKAAADEIRRRRAARLQAARQSAIETAEAEAAAPGDQGLSSSPGAPLTIDLT